MLVINQEKLPQTILSYMAFRLAGRATLQFIELSRQMPDVSLECQGFLTEVPFLREVPPQVQVDILAETWNKHVSTDSLDATMLDESVVYAACETAAYIVENNPELLPPLLEGGPLAMSVQASPELAEQLRQLHLNLANEGDFLLISQFLDMSPDEAGEWKQRYGLTDDNIEPMFNALSRWNPSPNVQKNLSGLLSPEEIRDTLPILGLTTRDPAES